MKTMIWFQFQTGSIKSETGTSSCKSKLPFQFQTGSIKSAVESAGMISLERFQFQTGSIKSRRRATRMRLRIVSIPNWFD